MTNLFKRINIILVFFVTLSFSCKESPVETNNNIKPGRRDYNWSIDSVDYGDLPGKIELYSIWGSSPDNVWGAGFTEDVRNCFWHYDGEKWRRAVWDTPIVEFGNGSKSVGGVWGTAADDVWAFGGRIFSSSNTTEPFIMHYDGIKWIEVMGDKSQMPDGFTDIYPVRKNHFWISSSDHVSEYKDGVWKKFYIGNNYYVQSINGTGNNVYIMTYPIGIDTLFLMKFEGNGFIKVDQTKLFSAGKFGPNGMLFTDKKVYTFGYGINSSDLENANVKNNWKIELQQATIGGGFWNSFKISYKDIWAVGYPSIAYQFNGENWQQIYLNTQISEATYVGIWGNGKEIFIADIENGKIYHGK